MSGPMPLLIAVGGMTLLVLLVVLVLVQRSLRDVPSGFALVVHSTSGEARVRFHRTLVMPFVQTAELIDIASKRVVIERSCAQGLRCKDGVRVGLRATFVVRVNPTAEDVLTVRKQLSSASLANPAFIQELFADRFTHALESVAAQLTAAEFERERERCKHEVMHVIGHELGGFVLDNVSLTDIVVDSPREPAAS